MLLSLGGLLPGLAGCASGTTGPRPVGVDVSHESTAGAGPLNRWRNDAADIVQASLTYAGDSLFIPETQGDPDPLAVATAYVASGRSASGGPWVDLLDKTFDPAGGTFADPSTDALAYTWLVVRSLGPRWVLQRHPGIESSLRSTMRHRVDSLKGAPLSDGVINTLRSLRFGSAVMTDLGQVTPVSVDARTACSWLGRLKDFGDEAQATVLASSVAANSSCPALTAAAASTAARLRHQVDTSADNLAPNLDALGALVLAYDLPRASVASGCTPAAGALPQPLPAASVVACADFARANDAAWAPDRWTRGTLDITIRTGGRTGGVQTTDAMGLAYQVGALRELRFSDSVIEAARRMPLAPPSDPMDQILLQMASGELKAWPPALANVSSTAVGATSTISMGVLYGLPCADQERRILGGASSSTVSDAGEALRMALAHTALSKCQPSTARPDATAPTATKQQLDGLLRGAVRSRDVMAMWKTVEAQCLLAMTPTLTVPDFLSVAPDYRKSPTLDLHVGELYAAARTSRILSQGCGGGLWTRSFT